VPQLGGGSKPGSLEDTRVERETEPPVFAMESAETLDGVESSDLP
jgi:hypothetical protein